jgi:hypothetical protein
MTDHPTKLTRKELCDKVFAQALMARRRTLGKSPAMHARLTIAG